MEEGVAVLDHVLLVLLRPPGPPGALQHVAAAAAGPLNEDSRLLGGHGQLVHLIRVGGAYAADKRYR